MAKLKPIVLVWLFFLAGIVAIVAMLPFAVTKRQKSTKALFCDQCATRLWVVSDELVGSAAPIREETKLEDTELSRWFRTHLSTNCQHTWRFNHSSGSVYLSFAGKRVYKISGATGSSPTPPIIYFSAADRARVESLLRESPGACRAFIQDRLQLKPETND